MVRLILFGLFFYLIYFLIKYLFFKPFKEGYRDPGGSTNRRRNTWSNPFSSQKEGDITIAYNPEKKHKDDKKVGEYVDYEDLKD